ncbi:hypothetical protein U1Q18_050236, partial [Sarracenia purpurea var. burkii]
MGEYVMAGDGIFAEATKEVYGIDTKYASRFGIQFIRMQIETAEKLPTRIALSLGWWVV